MKTISTTTRSFSSYLSGMHREERALDQDRCLYHVTQYLMGQDWQLIDPLELGLQIWGDLEGQELVEQTAVRAVQTAVWQRYAVILHDCCCQKSGEKYQRGWVELSNWLNNQVHHVVALPQEQEDVIQETLTELQSSFSQSPLNAPRALFAYALQTMRRKHIDLYRKRTAVMRGGDTDLYLEEISDADPGDEGARWEETIPANTDDRRSEETAVGNKEIRDQLSTFFRKHLPTDLQWQVAEAYFLDGLAPQEIAGLIGKRPHEIRMAKARALQTLRNLPPDARQTLLNILGQANMEEPHE